MNRVKCVFENKAEGREKKLIVTIPPSISTVSDFVQHVIHLYLESPKVHIVLIE